MRLRLVLPDTRSDGELLAEAHEQLEVERATVQLLTERVQGLLRALDQVRALLDERGRELDRMRASRMS